MAPFNLNLFKRKPKPQQSEPQAVVPPGRISQPEDGLNRTMALRSQVKLITPTFRTELIPLMRDLVKINPDMSIAVQDMYKLANTGHTLQFPHDTDSDRERMQKYLIEVGNNRWGQYNGGINGIVNKMIAQVLIGGAISVEAVPDTNLTGVQNIVFIKPETIRFERDASSSYIPYQKVTGLFDKDYVKLNGVTYTYAPLINDTDEPYGIPPFMAALDSLEGQHTMKNNFKFIMEQAGLLGFLEATIAKPAKLNSESVSSYEIRLNRLLTNFKRSILGGMSDGVVVGYDGDHNFKLNSTSKDISNFDKPWNMNQQSVANGLGVSGSIIGVNNANTEGGQGILLSKMISQLSSIQTLVAYVLRKIYLLELRLAGFHCKGLSVKFGTSTVSDELKAQQGLEIKLRNLTTLYNQGIISQSDFAWLSGNTKPDKQKPRLIEGAPSTVEKDKKREEDKDKSDRKSRDKDKPIPKRQDQKTPER